jgi:hypothetical protein
MRPWSIVSLPTVRRPEAPTVYRVKSKRFGIGGAYEKLDLEAVEEISMGRKNEQPAAEKKALKALRERRRMSIQAATRRMRTQKKAIQAIKDQLKNDALTVPQIAVATGAGTAETLWYIAALKKYGQIVEAEKEGSYFKYALAKNQPAESSDETRSDGPL